ncbi:MAG: hypothetical protein QOG87_4128 [Actinomycetota bacterium]|jgi:uncharacterized protein (TIGR03086 family)
MPNPDLEPAARRMADLVRNVPDDKLSAATPCPDYTLGDLIEHVGGLSLAFTAAATKTPLEGSDQGPSGDASRLDDDWRTSIPERLAALGAAWKDPEAWTGMTRAGGVDLPGEVGGLVALDELVVHGWDVAKASDQPYDPGADELEAVHGFVSQFAGDDGPDSIFGPPVPVPDDAPLLDRVIGLTGRDPSWSAA